MLRINFYPVWVRKTDWFVARKTGFPMETTEYPLGGGATATAPGRQQTEVCAVCKTDEWESDCCKTQHNHILGDDDDIVCCRCFVKAEGFCPDAWRYLEKEAEEEEDDESDRETCGCGKGKGKGECWQCECDKDFVLMDPAEYDAKWTQERILDLKKKDWEAATK